MKILWVNPHFLHPTTKGGHIRTLEMLRHLHRWHEVHYIALENADEPEGVRRSCEYCSRSYPIPHRTPPRGSVAFAAQAARNLLSSLPLAVSRYYSPRMKSFISDLLRREKFDRMVCDFLAAAPNIPNLKQTLLFQHNVETIIWQRHMETASGRLRKALFRMQANRMAAYEGRVCREAGHIVAVSETDAGRFRSMFGVAQVSEIPTGVDIDFFAPPASTPSTSDLVFVGSMDWLPNIDGCTYFVNEILPLIRQCKPDCSLAIVGRRPTRAILELAEKDANIQITGTVPDIRPYLWGSTVSIVPLRIGGGTRLKIYEAMAAKLPVVSTAVGAEGLPLANGRHIFLKDTPQAFADACLELLEKRELRLDMAQQAWDLVSSRFSWEQAARCFEEILIKAPALN
jgi:polysaccharide biosynthesis protein PslH